MKPKPIAILSFILALTLPRPAAGEPALNVFAAASTSEIVAEAARGFTRRTGIAVRLNPASSGSLARQIAAGAPADLFLSASSEWSDWLLERGELRPGSVRELMRNRLVVVAGLEAAVPAIRFSPDYAFAASFRGKLSAGDPAHVPAGRYAAEALKTFGWDRALHDRLLPAQDARGALLMVELGQCDLGIVYATDAGLSRKIRIVATVPEAAHTPIVYTLGICRDTRSPAAAAAFWSHLQTPEVAALLGRHGFVPSAGGEE